MKVPFLDLSAQYQPLKEAIARELNWVLENNAFILGKKVFDFEETFATYCNAPFCVAVNSGTSALHLALLAYDIGEGDEVITTANTFIATTEAISYTGAKPVLVDIDSKTYNMDAKLLEENITERTKAIIPVHLYGQPADMEAILAIAEKHKLIVIEDCCQAHGALYKGKRVPIGPIGCFSFYPGKNLGAYGEGGAIISKDPKIAEQMKSLRDHGQAQKYHHAQIGYNYRMSGFQGAVLGVKLPHLDEWIQKRREKAALYTELLKDVVIVPEELRGVESVYHLYIIRVEKREALMSYLSEKGIATGLHYPVPIHLQEAYADLGLLKGSYPLSERYADEILSLPMYPEISDEQIRYVCDSIKEFYEKQKDI